MSNLPSPYLLLAALTVVYCGAVLAIAALLYGTERAWAWLWRRDASWFRGWPLAYPNQVRLIAAIEDALWRTLGKAI